MLEFWRNSFEFLKFHDYPQQYLLGYSRLEAFVFGFCSWFVYAHFMTGFWFSNNVIAISYSIWVIEKWMHTKFWQVVLIFIGLIAYDVTFVFGSDVMMTVASQFESPMKILFPVEGGFAMLGIGDVIIPGLLVSLSLRIDFIRNMVAQSKEDRSQQEITTKEDVLNELQDTSKKFGARKDRFYFFNSLVGYNLGLIVCSVAMAATHNPQPALLYILPCQVFMYVGGAFMRRETIKMIWYDEDHALKEFEVKQN